jgi:hypothetical protein
MPVPAHEGQVTTTPATDPSPVIGAATERRAPRSHATTIDPIQGFWVTTNARNSSWPSGMLQSLASPPHIYKGPALALVDKGFIYEGSALALVDKGLIYEGPGSPRRLVETTLLCPDTCIDALGQNRQVNFFIGSE